MTQTTRNNNLLELYPAMPSQQSLVHAQKASLQSARFIGCARADAGHSGITMEAVGEVSAALERIILGKQRSSEEHWAVMAAEVEQRTQSTVMMRDLVMQYA